MRHFTKVGAGVLLVALVVAAGVAAGCGSSSSDSS